MHRINSTERKGTLAGVRGALRAWPQSKKGALNVDLAFTLSRLVYNELLLQTDKQTDYLPTPAFSSYISLSDVRFKDVARWDGTFIFRFKKHYFRRLQVAKSSRWFEFTIYACSGTCLLNKQYGYNLRKNWFYSSVVLWSRASNNSSIWNSVVGVKFTPKFPQWEWRLAEEGVCGMAYVVH